MKNHNQPNGNKNKIMTLAATALAATALSGIATGEASAKTKHHKETPVEALTTLISKLDKGGHVEVASKYIPLAGPVGTGLGRPIVFKADGKRYFAYQQDKLPGFYQEEPAEVAGHMAITPEPSKDKSMPLTQAHINNNEMLVDENNVPVGYSGGGS